MVATIFIILFFSYLNDWVRCHLRLLFTFCLWLITFHYFYLFEMNAGEINWVVGSFVTVTAITLCIFSNTALLLYSLYVTILSIILVFIVPALAHSVFLPGILTILIQANIGLRSRLSLLKTLADSNERFQLLFNNTFEGILVHEDGLITNVNESLSNLLGIPREKLIGTSALDIIHPDERARVAEKMKIIDVAAYETTALKKDGSPINVEARAKNFIYADHIARLVTIRDITDRKNAEKERVSALTLAENVRNRDEFISIASHELKTPITSLKLQTQMIERNLKRDPSNPYPNSKLIEFVTLFNRQIDRLTELVETMLDVSQISAGKLTLDQKNMDLSEVVREVATVLQLPNSKPEGFTFPQITLELPEHLIIWADRSRIKQVVENLFSNAIKYGAGKPIVVKVQDMTTHALLAFEDHGLGIAPEFINRIFNRFKRAISARNITGLGLGLYITRQIVEAHQGKISVVSQLGEGSTFTVSLPVKP